MPNISILIALLLQLCTMMQGLTPCSKYFSYTFKPQLNKILGQIKIPSAPQSGQYHLKVGLLKCVLTHISTNQPITELEIAPPVEETIRGIQQGKPLLYHVHFKTRSEWNQVPKITKIWFNNQQLCPNEKTIEFYRTTVVVEKVYSSEEQPTSNNPLNLDDYNECSKNDELVMKNNDETDVETHDDNALFEQYRGYLVERGHWPWLAALMNDKNQYLCAGTILTKKHVLTAAHCLKVPHSNDNRQPNELEVLLGRYNLYDPSEIGSVSRKVESYKIHPDYTHTESGDSDLAILILIAPVEYSFVIKPICLWSQSTDLQDVQNQIGYVAGWGKDESNNYPPEPWMTHMPIVSQDTCRRSNQRLSALISMRTFCAGWRNNTGPCNGDSGGGFVLFNKTTNHHILRGVVSRALSSLTPQCNLYHYIVYVDVAKYIFWIQEQIKITT